jgi:hypothetical protein
MCMCEYTDAHDVRGCSALRIGDTFIYVLLRIDMLYVFILCINTIRVHVHVHVCVCVCVYRYR